jgi:hypothetical protein
MWVFDDERVGLVKEPFVMGIPEIIDKAVTHLSNPEKVLLFCLTIPAYRLLTLSSKNLI